MGNRAVISFGREANAPSIYLHWNGGVSSVQGFLDAAKALGVRANDPVYGCARVAQIIGNFFGGTLSLGVGPANSLDKDNMDNGQYIVEGLEIVDRKFAPSYAEPLNQAQVNAICAACIEINKPIFERGL